MIEERRAKNIFGADREGYVKMNINQRSKVSRSIGATGRKGN